METTIHEPPKAEPRKDPSKGNGGARNLVPDNGGLLAGEQPSPPPASMGVWVGLSAITMSFAAFTSALIVRQGASPDWRHFSLPAILYLNTLLLLLSSVTLEAARRRVSAFMGGSRVTSPALWLYATLALGLFFLSGQYVAWLQLKSQGLYLA